jgi:hypothetical protein
LLPISAFCFLLSPFARRWLWLTGQPSGFNPQLSSLTPVKPSLDHEQPGMPVIADICRNRGVHKMGEQDSLRNPLIFRVFGVFRG